MGTLVELSGKTLNRKIWHSSGLHCVRDSVGGRLAENPVGTAFDKFRSETEQIIHAKESETPDVETEIGIQFTAQTFSLRAELRTFLYKYS